MNLATVEGILTLAVACPLLALATLLLVRQVLKFHNPVTVVQALSVALLLLHTVVYGLVFLNNDMPALGFGPPIIALETTRIITRTTELITGVIVASAVLWLLLPSYIRKRGP